jgi:heme oxygenase
MEEFSRRTPITQNLRTFTDMATLTLQEMREEIRLKKITKDLHQEIEAEFIQSTNDHQAYYEVMER